MNSPTRCSVLGAEFADTSERFATNQHAPSDREMDIVSFPDSVFIKLLDLPKDSV
jgi:hypothetical protein